MEEDIVIRSIHLGEIIKLLKARKDDDSSVKTALEEIEGMSKVEREIRRHRRR